MQLQRKGDELRRALQSIESLCKDKSELTSRVEHLLRQLHAKDGAHESALANLRARGFSQTAGMSPTEAEAMLGALERAEAHGAERASECVRLVHALADAERALAASRSAAADVLAAQAADEARARAAAAEAALEQQAQLLLEREHAISALREENRKVSSTPPTPPPPPRARSEARSGSARRSGSGRRRSRRSRRSRRATTWRRARGWAP